MTPEDLLDLIALEDVIEAGLQTGLKDFDGEALASMVMRAFRKWAVPDFEELAIEGVEQRFVLELRPSLAFHKMELIPHCGVTSEESRSYGPYSYKGFVDLVGTRSVHKVVYDYKVVGSITEERVSTQLMSWQGPTYATAYGADAYAYRFIQRDGRTREAACDWPNGYGVKEVSRYVQSVLNYRAFQWTDGPWLQHKPFACKAYGQWCPHVTLCETNTAPVAFPPEVPLSHSGAEKLLLCPERYRLDAVVGAAEDKERTQLGTAFHACQAELYRQLMNLQQKGVNAA